MYNEKMSLHILHIFGIINEESLFDKINSEKFKSKFAYYYMAHVDIGIL